MQIRIEKLEDIAAVETVNKSAFETSAEANIVSTLREKTPSIVSLVAEEDDKIVGHILFSPVELSGSSKRNIVGLAPMAVVPEYQRRGIGSKLVQTGLEECRRRDFSAVVVLGHPEYYPRFGFKPASQFNIKCEYDVPDEAFLVIELEPNYLDGASGTIKYDNAFKDV